MKIVLFIIAFIFGVSSAGAAEMTEPGGTPEATKMAVFDPDEFAWQLFLFISQQAEKGTAGVPDKTKKDLTQFDPDADVVWESWALATGGEVVPSKSEVFKNPATEPVPWDELRAAPSAKVLSPAFKSSPFVTMRMNLQEIRPSALSEATPLFIPDPALAGEDETRMNRSTYDTIRSNRLWSIEGIEAAYVEAEKRGDTFLVRFDQVSKEVKARWVKLSNPGADKSRYHWRSVRTVEPDGSIKEEVWGLAALHIITRDLPNWFWADFGHVDFEVRATTKPVDSTTRDENAPDGKAKKGTKGVRNETKNTKWENYILRGTQIDFLTPNGAPTILSNPVIESQDQISSCIHCHARASAGLRTGIAGNGPGIPIIQGKDPVNNIGSDFDAETNLGPGNFTAGQPKPVFLHTDFLWSLPFRAFSEKP